MNTKGKFTGGYNSNSAMLTGTHGSLLSCLLDHLPSSADILTENLI